MKTIVYKVVKRTPKKYKSVFVCDKYKLFYRLNKETIAKIGKIFVFKTKEHAERFISSYVSQQDPAIILQCETLEIPEFLSRRSGTTRNGEMMARFWKNIGHRVHCPRTPFGTYGVKSLTPIKEVKT